MRGFEKIFYEIGITQEKISQFSVDGWGSDDFIKFLSPDELMCYFSISDDPLIEELIENYIIKIRNKKSIEIQDKAINSNPNWIISTGSIKLDQLLDHTGISPGDLILFYGKFRSGKSQIAHQCCVNIFNYIKPKKPTLLSLFIDTEGTFRPERIQQMSLTLPERNNELLQSISVIKIKSVNELEIFLPKIDDFVKNQQIKLIIFDSLTSIFRVELAKPDIASSKTIQQFVKIGKKFLEWTKEYQVAVICTSQITSAMSKTFFFDVIPVLSPILNQFFKQAIFLAENEDITDSIENRGRRFAHLVNGQNKKESIAQFIITENGIQDYY